MYIHSRYRFTVEPPKEDTPVWLCTKEDCKGWMRDNFAFDHIPTCCLCDSPMKSGTMLLPSLKNSNRNLKSAKKGVSIQK